MLHIYVIYIYISISSIIWFEMSNDEILNLSGLSF